MRHTNPLLLTLNGQFYPPYNIVFLFQVILNSMHKFQPRIYLVKRSEGVNGPVTDIEKEKYRTFVFPETQFTAVTAYQNQLVSYEETFYRSSNL